MPENIRKNNFMDLMKDLERRIILLENKQEDGENDPDFSRLKPYNNNNTEVKINDNKNY